MLDELERVRAYRSEVSDPNAASVARARAELLEAVRNEPHRRPAADKRLARVGKLQRRRRFVLAGGLATAAVAVAGVLGLSPAAAPSSALASEMNQLAQVAASQAWAGIPGPGQYLYTDSEGLTESDTYAGGRTCVVDLIDHRRIWIATDGSGALAETLSGARFTPVSGEMTLAEDQSNCSDLQITDPASQDSSSTNTFAAGGLSFPTENWKALSTDPATLLKQIHQLDGGPNDPGELFVNVGDFLRESDAPPAIRAALYKAAALIPGVQLIGQQTDQFGRTGLGLDFPYPNGKVHSVLIIDQSTAALMAEEYYAPDGTLSSWTAYRPSRIVDTLPDYPQQPTSNGSSDPSGTQHAKSSTSSNAGPAAAAATATTSTPSANAK
jgi:RNA polymerase sigma-70 factor (ECF subfamily)